MAREAARVAIACWAGDVARLARWFLWWSDS
jgi:hypothetical protein